MKYLSPIFFQFFLALPFALITCLITCLCSCSSLPGGGLSNYTIVYTGTSVEVSDFTTPVPPGAEATTVTGVGWDLKAKSATVVYADGHRQALKVTGGGIGGNKVILTLEGGGRITVDLATRKVSLTASPVTGPVVIPATSPAP